MHIQTGGKRAAIESAKVLISKIFEILADTHTQHQIGSGRPTATNLRDAEKRTDRQGERRRFQSPHTPKFPALHS